MSKVYKFLSKLSLFGTTTNIIYLSPIVILLLPFSIIQFIVSKTKVIHKSIYYLILFLMVTIINIVLYEPSMLIDFSFYRRDGNLFISYMPIVVLGLISVNIDLKKVITNFIRIGISINILFLIIYIATGGNFVKYEAGIYYSAFTAHNAAGGFLTMFSAFLIGQLIYKYKLNSKINIKMLLIVTMSLFFLYMTNSRGSMIGLILALLVFRLKPSRSFFIFLFISFLFFFAIYYYSYPIWVDNGMKISEFSVSGVDLEFLGRGHTIINRVFYLWPRAIHLFLESPIFGMGFGSYNDWPYNFQEILPYIKQNQSEIITYSDGHAHNSFLHILSEQGIIGYILIIIFLSYTLKFITKQDISVRYSLLLMFWTLIYSSFTEHRLVTPAQALPFTIFLGIVFMNYNFKRRYKNNEKYINNHI